MIYTPFDQQREFFLDPSRIRCLFAAKRSGKTEIGLLDALRHAEERPGWRNNNRDPWQAAFIAPTEGMLKRLTWPKFRSFSKHFEAAYGKQENRLDWHNGSIIWGISGEKIERIEGLKLNYILMDEVLQMSEHVFLEALARVSDSQGKIVIMGSLGSNIPNPKSHWVYKTFKEPLKPFPNSRIWEWTTADNPHFPQEELARLKDTLDPRTYRQLFCIDWNVPGTALVYDQFDESNLTKWNYNPDLETCAAVDWGFAHPMVCLFFQVDPRAGKVILFDEIVLTRQTREVLLDRIKAKNYRVAKWYCDIAGNKETEETGISNVSWFKDRGIHFSFRRTAITYGITIVRSYIRNGKGIASLLVDERCRHSLDDIRNYRYPEKDGVILNEKPEKDNSFGSFDCIDAIRYFFVNRLDPAMQGQAMQSRDRFKTWNF